MRRVKLSVYVAAAIGIGVAATVFAQPGGTGGVRYLPSDKVQATFAKGGPLLQTSTYKVLASRRDADGRPEVHARDTDIFYFLEGTATLVTGGKVVGGKQTAPDEILGESIEGGSEQPVTKGDIVTIDAGVPHVFKNVKAPFLYYTVKVTAPK